MTNLLLAELNILVTEDEYFLADELKQTLSQSGAGLVRLSGDYHDAIVIPPAVMLIGIAAAGSLFGLLGIVLAGPLVVVAYVTIKTLWVRDTLEQPV